MGMRRERIRTEIRQDVGRGHQDRCHTCVGTTSSAEPLPVELTYPEELRTSQDDAVCFLPSTSGCGRW